MIGPFWISGDKGGTQDDDLVNIKIPASKIKQCCGLISYLILYTTS